MWKLLATLGGIVSTLSSILVKKHWSKDSNEAIQFFGKFDDIPVDKTCGPNQCATYIHRTYCGVSIYVKGVASYPRGSMVTIYLSKPIIKIGHDNNYMLARFDSGQAKKYYYRILDHHSIGSSIVELIGEDDIKDFIRNCQSAKKISLELPIIDAAEFELKTREPTK